MNHNSCPPGAHIWWQTKGTTSGGQGKRWQEAELEGNSGSGKQGRLALDGLTVYDTAEVDSWSLSQHCWEKGKAGLTGRTETGLTKYPIFFSHASKSASKKGGGMMWWNEHWDLGRPNSNHGFTICDIRHLGGPHTIQHELAFTHSFPRYSLSTYYVQEPPRGYRCVTRGLTGKSD